MNRYLLGNRASSHRLHHRLKLDDLCLSAQCVYEKKERKKKRFYKESYPTRTSRALRMYVCTKSQEHTVISTYMTVDILSVYIKVVKHVFFFSLT